LPQLGPHLPPQLVQQPWHLLYSTTQGGFSLQTLYQCSVQPGSPAQLLIRDTEAPPWGSHAHFAHPSHLASSAGGQPGVRMGRWLVRHPGAEEGVEGTHSQLHHWNLPSGRFRLWLDGDLHHSSNHPCKTLDNETLSPPEEFCIQDLEVWGLA
ncbi:TLDC2 protein, partial [Piaya cayana]|nr:TLDC2 protein [Piaya cayana]